MATTPRSAYSHKNWLRGLIGKYSNLSYRNRERFVSFIENRISEIPDEPVKEYLRKIKETLTFRFDYFQYFENLKPTKTIKNLNVVFLPLENNGFIVYRDFRFWLFVSSKTSKKRTGKTIRWGLKRANQGVILHENID